MSKQFMDARIPAVASIGSGDALEREPLEIARATLMHAEKHGTTCLYVDGRAGVHMRRAEVVYADELPAIWLVGTYTASAGVVRIMEDLQLRVAEVRAARG